MTRSTELAPGASANNHGFNDDKLEVTPNVSAIDNPAQLSVNSATPGKKPCTFREGGGRNKSSDAMALMTL